MPEFFESAQLIKDLLVLWAFHFSAATLLMFVAKGSKAFQWDPGLIRSVRVNWTFVATNMLLTPFSIATTIFIYQTASALGLPRLPEDMWASVPAPIRVLFAFVAVDFFEYWEHRIKHHKVLWPLHGVHHSETEMNYMSWQRVHLLDGFLHHVMFVLLGLFLGFGYVEIAVFVMIRTLHQQYVHMNLDWVHGPLEKWIASPRFHRWHHADVEEAHDKNFALMFSIWDHLFGTYYCPGPCEDVPTGFDGSPGDNFLKLQWFPFKTWAGMLIDRRRSQQVKISADTP